MVGRLSAGVEGLVENYLLFKQVRPSSAFRGDLMAPTAPGHSDCRIDRAHWIRRSDSAARATVARFRSRCSEASATEDLVRGLTSPPPVRWSMGQCPEPLLAALLSLHRLQHFPLVTITVLWCERRLGVFVVRVLFAKARLAVVPAGLAWNGDALVLGAVAQTLHIWGTVGLAGLAQACLRSASRPLTMPTPGSQRS